MHIVQIFKKLGYYLKPTCCRAACSADAV